MEITTIYAVQLYKNIGDEIILTKLFQVFKIF